MTLRTDHFWEARGGYAPPAQEVFEAVLIAAQREPEERKPSPALASFDNSDITKVGESLDGKLGDQLTVFEVEDSAEIPPHQC